MVRSAVADESLLSYLTNLAKHDTCTVGLILGQPAESKDYVIHFAKTPPSQGEVLAKKDIMPAKQVKTLADIADAWVAEHAKCTTRMLPGGMYVLGIFIVSQEDVLTPLAAKIKSILLHITKQLGNNVYLNGNAMSSEKLVLNYCAATESFSCKAYDTSTSSVKPADFKFMPKATRWHQLECRCELDQTCPIPQSKIDWPLRKHMTDILRLTSENLKQAKVLFDHEVKDASENLESVGKKKNRGKSGRQELAENKPMHVTIFLPCDCSNMSPEIELIDCGGHIRITGQIVCKLWLHPKATVGFASQAVIEDIVRSLAARLEMHWDSLTEEEHGSPEDTNSVHEPPRRVLVSLPDSTVTLSDYLFPGEGPQEAQISLQEMLDIKVNENDDIKDVEGQADLNEYYNEGLDADSDETLVKLQKVTNKFVYMVGIGAALVVLFLSIVIHFFTG